MRLIIASGIALVIMAALGACQAEPQVGIMTRAGREVVFKVEIADTAAKRELGLQYRRELPPDRGMIFLFPREDRLSFWMKNTVISLDMIFIGADQTIVGIVENAAPFSLEGRSVTGLSKYVLEINGGLSRRYGFAAGDRVRFEGFSSEIFQ